MKRFKINKELSAKFTAISLAGVVFLSGFALGKSSNKQTSQTDFITTDSSMNNLTSENSIAFNNKNFQYDTELDTYVEESNVGKFTKDIAGNYITKEFYDMIYVFDSQVNKYLHFYDYGKYQLDKDGNMINNEGGIISLYDTSKNGSFFFNTYTDFEKWTLANYSGYVPCKGIMIPEETYKLIEEELSKIQGELVEESGYGTKKIKNRD